MKNLIASLLFVSIGLAASAQADTFTCSNPDQTIKITGPVTDENAGTEELLKKAQDYSVTYEGQTQLHTLLQADFTDNLAHTTYEIYYIKFQHSSATKGIIYPEDYVLCNQQR